MNIEKKLYELKKGNFDERKLLANTYRKTDYN